MSGDDFERIDRIPGDPIATAWRRAARQHQSAWREAHGWPKGTQSLGKDRGMRPIGSRVDTASGLAGVNFLSDATRRAVDHRLAKPQRQKFETLNETRLRCDLLSSTPMCFNLFGSMWADPALASEVTHRWFPGLCPVGADVEVLFECSPGRADPRWLDDRNAFDASLRIRTDGNVHLIGIETKYHEYPITEPAVRRHDGVEVRREMKQRYRDVSQHANLLSDTASIDQLWGTDVEQVWRDHLLAFACQQESSEIAAVRYVLVAPEQNPPWSKLARRYTELLHPTARPTFEFRTLDSMIDDANDLLPHAAEFRERYLDIAL